MDDEGGTVAGGRAIEVEVSDLQGALRLEPDWLEGLVRRALGELGVAEASLSIAVVDDPTIHRINREHLGHDWPTDVITFPLSGPGEPPMAGELVVSAERAAATAAAAGVDPRCELALYVVHGLLHLCGHDDTDPVTAGAMRRREGEILATLGLDNPYAAVAAVGG